MNFRLWLLVSIYITCVCIFILAFMPPTATVDFLLEFERTSAETEAIETPKAAQALSYLPRDVDDAFVRRYAAIHREIVDNEQWSRVIVFSTTVGGLGDRIAAMINALLIAMLMDYAFFVDMGPELWSSYVSSPYFDTSFESIRPLLKKAGVLPMRRVIMGLDGSFVGMWRGFPDRLTKEPLEDLMPPGEGPVVILINQLLVQYLYQNPVYHKRIHNEWKIDRLAEDPGAVQWNQWDGSFKYSCTIYDGIIGVMYKILAAPKPWLQERLNHFLEDHFGKRGTLCMHFRFGGSRSTFSKDYAFNTDESYFFRCAEQYRNVTDKWFIAADDNSVIVDAKEREGDRIVFVSGTPMHHDFRYTGTASGEVMTKIFMDHFLFEYCDVSIISQSGYSRFSLHRAFVCPHIFKDSDPQCMSTKDVPRPLAAATTVLPLD